MRILTAGLALAWTLNAAALAAAPVPTDPKKDNPGSPAEKIRLALDKNIALLDFNGQPITAAVQKISEDIGISLVLDTFTIQQMGFDPNQMMVHFKAKDVKARTALRSLVGQFNLSFAVVGDNVLITTDEMAMYRQMRQRVNIDYDNTEFAGAIKRLARDTATNLIIDSRSAKEAKGNITLQLEDVPLETAVRLMSEMVGLKPVRVGNVMFICSKEAAKDLKTDPDIVPPNPMGPRGYATDGFNVPNFALPCFPALPPNFNPPITLPAPGPKAPPPATPPPPGDNR